MRWFFVMLLYRLLLPVLLVAAFPGWIVKMLRRGGFRTRLGERAAIYRKDAGDEPPGAVHLHAVSVGEALLAIKMIRVWSAREPGRRFVLATGTATGHAVAADAALPGVRVTYSPLDMTSMVRRYLDRFRPSRIVLIEAEVWPHLLIECRKRGIPVSLANARMSPRSARRYRRFARNLRPLFSMLDAVAVQEADDAEIWQELGVEPSRIHHTGSMKFDPGSAIMPEMRAEFQEILDAFGKGRPVILAASTHAGEDAWIASAVADAVPHALPVVVPRHAERRAEVRGELERAGFHVVMRSAGVPSAPVVAAGEGRAVLLVDSTGELRDWTAHADAVIIGKSILANGGQNPAEAILAGKPVVFGPHMENFQPLASHLAAAGACLQADDMAGLQAAIRSTLDPENAAAMTRQASGILARHNGATDRMVVLFSMPGNPEK